MKTILVPVDFSETSANALQYAADFSKDIDVDRIILLKSVYLSMYAQLLPSADFVQLSSVDISSARREAKEQLKEIGHQFIRDCDDCVKVETAISELPLLRAIHQVIEEQKPNLLIAGSGGSSFMDDSYIGGQVVAIAKTSAIPVLIIPSKVKYQTVKKALVPCDFAAIDRLGVLDKIPGSKKWINPELLVLNIATSQKHQTENDGHTTALKDLLDNYKYKTYCEECDSTVKGILTFAQKYDVQLIIALPGKYSFFYSFTHTSITDALTQNTTHPVLILK
ncbi:universal stress protein [Mucilaginibacter sp. X4EP1]|uniref:universal stress protein n=1 Tax=Mucilaginibacter sp. X4EP1 TaxID=2723092 RepID=UPI002167FBF2|nr:universal stress protein [Mucilaginibacter sp. X4EP1]MCS3813379.1 nucleotide-binding universal stress UspA family protein [Mucilaginibacter sp. X4EP1]